MESWENTNNFHEEYANALVKCNSITPRILGIDIKCGAPLLQIKNKLRTLGITNVTMYAYTKQTEAYLDLQTICGSENVICAGEDEILSHYIGNEFDYIILGDYINKYSGFTVVYTIGRGPGSKEVAELISYHDFDRYTEELNDREDVWMYWGDQTKEVRFIPSLVANKRQIAFILNMDSEYAKEIVKNDVWNPDFDKETITDFIDYRYLEKFLVERNNRNAMTTDRETAIMFGLPSKLIEGVFVGRKVENDDNMLDYIKDKLPDCYICNLDGKVIRK